ncbi:MAG: molybdenum cofactor guanylyltransferase [Rhizobium sp.]|nr:MAG: molybdenum cofactor guanylyltransferase [Rhizobium sp.]
MTSTSSVQDFSLSACILAGGLGTRLGGVDKGWIEVGGIPLVQRVMDCLRAQVNAGLINANRGIDEYARLGWPVVADGVSDFAGPLAGISAGLDAARTEWVLFVPVDAARLPGDLAPRLCEAVKQNGSPAAFVCTSEGPMPVCCLVSRSLRDGLRQALADGERSVIAWLRGLQAATVLYEEWPLEYWSLNTPEERARVEALLLGDH